MLRRLAFHLILSVFGATTFSGSLLSQTFDLAAAGPPNRRSRRIDALSPRRRSTLAWADPDFDDSSWALIRGIESVVYARLSKPHWICVVPVQGHAAQSPRSTGFVGSSNRNELSDLCEWTLGRRFRRDAAAMRVRAAGQNLVFSNSGRFGAIAADRITIAIRVWYFPWALEPLGGSA